MSFSSLRSPLRISLSYHGLANPAVAARIVASTGLAPPMPVIEIGPGEGMLTDALLRRGFPVSAVESDPQLAAQLRERHRGQPSLRVVQQDFLRYGLPSQGRYAVVANPPFARTSEILRRLLGASNPPYHASLVLQREAAFRWGGLQGETALSVVSKVRFEFAIQMAVRRRDFRPYPAVDCVVLGITKRPAALLEPAVRERFARFVQLGFGRGRGTLRKNLAPELSYVAFRAVARRTNLELDALPSEASISHWLALFGRDGEAHTVLGK